MRASRTSGIWVAAVAVAALVLGALAASAMATRTLTIGSKVTLSVYGYKGKVSSANKGCVEERTVVLKQKGQGVLGRAKTKASGSWEVPPEELHFKGKLPYKLFAEVKPSSEGAAGTIYKCLGATSKTVEIAGG